MSVAIVFPNGTDWFKANWGFRQLAEDTTSHHREDDGICNALEEPLALGCLDLKKMDLISDAESQKPSGKLPTARHQLRTLD